MSGGVSLGRLRELVDRALEVALALLMTVMVVAVLWQIASRFLLRDPSSVTEELVRFGLLWLALLGAAYAYGRGAHLAVDLLARRHPRLRIAVRITVALFALLVLVLGGSRLVDTTLLLGQTSAALGVDRGYVYLVLPLTGGLLVFYALGAPAERKG